ncbi:hypothetical protein [Streptomyces palmae]|uniref:Lipoprotein n=1 Tax=Streptomyces palmae TaxID=1701085 RepID=A0A4Z0H577_9ACTN|nr:hypothetical protein [Streptomyces palmae]TGB05778.1 hypothetical protein E4099_18850 [Streptomyces palmae]
MIDSDRRGGRRARLSAPAAGLMLCAAALALTACAGGGTTPASDRDTPTHSAPAARPSGAPSDPAAGGPAPSPTSRLTTSVTLPPPKPGQSCAQEGTYRMRLKDDEVYICRNGHWQSVGAVHGLPTTAAPHR